jgi:drug/metabolite transporter (DMT)-like permease
MKKLLFSRPAALLFLTGITAIWGWSFVIVKDSISVYPVFSFLSLRFFLGSLLLLPFLGRSLFKMNMKVIAAGFALGLFLFSGYAFQTTGLLYTTPSHSGFITGLFVVFTPVFEALIFKKRPSAVVIVSLILSTAGLLILSYQPDLKGINIGDFLSLICAIIYAFHLILIDRFSKKFDTLQLAFLQIFTVSLFSFAAAVITVSEFAPVPAIALRGLILTAVFATALSYYVQTTYQKITTATEAALIFTLEPIFAGIFAYYMWGENISVRTFIGGVFIFTGMAVSQVRYFFFRSGGRLIDEKK